MKITPMTATLAAALAILTACADDGEVERNSMIHVITTATANEPAPGLPAAADKLLEHAARSTTGTLEILVPDDGKLSSVGDSTPLAVMRGSEIENDPVKFAEGLKSILDTVEGNLSSVASNQAVLDLLTGLNRAAEYSEHSTIVAISSGLQTSGLADFAGLGWDFSIDEVLDDLDVAGFLPNLTGHRIVFVGLGETAGDQTPLPEPMRRKVEDFWMGLCERGSAYSCESLTADADTAEPVSTTPARTVAVPNFALPQMPLGVTNAEWSMSSTALFAPDSAYLLPNVSGQLSEVSAQLRSRGARVDLIGHTWKVGDPDTARELSLQRARAIANALVATGLPQNSIGEVRGVGYDELITPAGADELSTAAANRVVIMRITTG